MANVDPAVRYMSVSGWVKTVQGIDPDNSADRHAEYLTALALVAGSWKMATEIRNLQRTEIRRWKNLPLGTKAPAMPHKRNPMMSERVTGLSRIIRSNALVGWKTWPCGMNAT